MVAISMSAIEEDDYIDAVNFVQLRSIKEIIEMLNEKNYFDQQDLVKNAENLSSLITEVTESSANHNKSLNTIMMQISTEHLADFAGKDYDEKRAQT